MIHDQAKVSLFDGKLLRAIDVDAGKLLLSFSPRMKPTQALVENRRIEERTDTKSLLLSNGQKFTGSPDQKVAAHRQKTVRFVPLVDIEIGDRLRGELTGMPTILDVIGLAFDPRPIRMVHLDTHDRNFVAEGVLCR